jgi:DHA1 family putative efflux transporter-like MFS transporter
MRARFAAWEECLSNNVMIWMLSLGALLSGTSQQYILGMPDKVIASCGVSLSDVSLVMTLFGLASALAGPLLLIALGRRSQRFQIMFGLSVMCVGLIIFALAPNFPLMLVGRVIMGAGNGVYIPISYSFSQTLAEPARRGRAMANVALGFSVATVLAMPLARALRDVVTWHAAYLFFALVALALFTIAWRFFPEKVPTAAVAGLSARLAPLKNRSILIAVVGTFFEFSGFACLYTYITPYLDGAVPWLAQQVSLILLAVGIMGMLGAKLCGWLCDTIGAPRTIVAGLVAQLVFLALLGIVIREGVATIPVLCLWSCASSMFVAAQNVVLAHLGGQSAGLAIALSNSFLQLGNAAGAGIAGIAVGIVPLALLPLCAAPLTALSLVLELLAFRHLKKD